MKKISSLLLFLLCLNIPAGDFPIGIYSLDPIGRKNYQNAADSGFNYVFYYVNILSNEKRAELLLNTAGECGLKVALQVVRAKSVLQDPDHFEKLRNAVRKWKNHPALGMWYLYDEPVEEQHALLLKIYQMLKQETPDVPVALCIAWVKNYQIFKDCADILMPDFYPVKNQPFPDAPLNHFTHFIWAVKRLKKPVMPIAQIMSFINYPKVVKVDPKTCRTPNAEELRYFGLAAMTMDVCGISYYSFWDIWRQKQLSYLYDVAKPVFLELQEFAGAVRGMKFQCHSKRIGSGYPPAFFCSSWQKDGKCLIVFVNNTPKKAGGTFRLESGIPKGKLIPWGKTRDAKVTNSGNGIVIDQIQPWEVFVWCCQQ